MKKIRKGFMSVKTKLFVSLSVIVISIIIFLIILNNFVLETFYYYNKREESITTSKIKMKNYCDIVSICSELLDYEVVNDFAFENAYRNIIMSYIMLSEEIYRGMSMEDRKKGKINRRILMNNVKQRKSRVGILNYFVAEFPSLFYTVREIRRKIR